MQLIIIRTIKEALITSSFIIVAITRIKFNKVAIRIMHLGTFWQIKRIIKFIMAFISMLSSFKVVTSTIINDSIMAAIWFFIIKVQSTQVLLNISIFLLYGVNRRFQE
jgi:hypothetical protein